MRSWDNYPYSTQAQDQLDRHYYRPHTAQNERRQYSPLNLNQKDYSRLTHTPSKLER